MFVGIMKVYLFKFVLIWLILGNISGLVSSYRYG